MKRKKHSKKATTKIKPGVSSQGQSPLDPAIVNHVIGVLNSEGISPEEISRLLARKGIKKSPAAISKILADHRGKAPKKTSAGSFYGSLRDMNLTRASILRDWVN